MKNKGFRDLIEYLLEKHMPIYLCDEAYVMNIVNAICDKTILSKWEVLMLAYSIGADNKETNQLLAVMGHQPLYVKRWEDAIWKFVISKRMDLTSVIKHIFPQEEDEYFN